MFKTPIITVSFLLLAFSASAQKGLRIGPTATFLSSRSYVIDSLPDNFNFRYKSGISGGFSLQYGFTERFVLGTGLNYTSKGYRVFNDTNSKGNLVKHNIGNIELPINAIFKMRIGSTSRMRGLVGTTLNYSLGKTSYTAKNTDGSFNIIEKNLNKIYPMLNLGLEIATENKGGNVFILGVYYKQSISNQAELNVYNSSNLTTNSRFNLGFRGSYLGIGVTYLFDTKNFKKTEEYFY